MNKNNIISKFHIFVGIISLFLIVTFTLQNSEVVSLNFLFWKLEMSRVVLILMVLLIGFLLGYILRSLQKR